MRLFDIFIEAVWDVSAAPFGSQASFFATINFAPEQVNVAIVAATLGAAVACAINWFIGDWLGKRLLKKQPSEKLMEFRAAFTEYGWPLLFLAWAPFGNFLPLLAGALGYGVKKTVILSGASMLGYYLYVSFS